VVTLGRKTNKNSRVRKSSAMTTRARGSAVHRGQQSRNPSLVSWFSLC
jgi:hypothetical protein